MKWRNFNHAGQIYDLSHLDPRLVRFSRHDESGKAAEVFDVDVSFTSHCFTRKPHRDERYHPSLIYPDDCEFRLFDLRRYEMSKLLPALIEALPSSKPRHNRQRGNYLSTEIVTQSGATLEYDIFFKVRKPLKGRLEMLIETAFIRDPEYGSTRPTGKPVRFWIILHNTRHGLKIRT